MSVLFAAIPMLLVSSPWISLPSGGDPVGVHTTGVVLEGGGSTALLELPLVPGEGDDPAVSAMNGELSWESLTGERIDETVAIYAATQHGFTGAGFTVGYDQGGILSITIRIESYGAYPDEWSQYLCFDTSTGCRLGISELLDPDEVDSLVSLLDSMLRDNIAEEIESEGADLLDADIYEGYSFTEENLNAFSITEDGIWFHYPFGFPHVIKAMEPDGDLFLPSEAFLPFTPGVT